MHTAAEIIALLKLEPLPGEGGFFRQTYASAVVLPGGRAAGTAIYFLITPDGFSALHTLATEEVWHFYAGDPVEHLRLGPAARTGVKTLLGPDLALGRRPQLVVPARACQGARLAAGGRWALCGCTMSPGWAAQEFALAGRAALLAQFPAWAADIHALTR